MHNPPLRLATLALACALLAACGRSDTLAPLAQQETVTSTLVTTPTLAPIDETATLVAAIATQDAMFPQPPAVLTAIAAPENQTAIALDATEVQSDIDSAATSMAWPTPAITRTPPIYPTSVPEPTLMGIYTERCADWFEIDGITFGVNNCWYGRFDNVEITLDAGFEVGTTPPAIRGGLVVFTRTVTLATPEPGATDTIPPAWEHLYWMPAEAGKPQIVSVTNEHVALETPNGTRFYFNLLTRVWEDQNGVPLPTPTP
jgi:hypothetical protein